MTTATVGIVVVVVVVAPLLLSSHPPPPSSHMLSPSSSLLLLLLPLSLRTVVSVRDRAYDSPSGTNLSLLQNVAAM